MRKLNFGVGAAVLLLSANVSAFAAGGSVEFSGSATGGCSFSNAQNGSIEVDGSLMRWTTKTPATIEVTQTGGADSNVTITVPQDWKTSPASPPTATFEASASILSGPNANAVFSGASPSAVLANAGVDTISVYLTVIASAPFKAGSYAHEVTLNCSASPGV